MNISALDSVNNLISAPKQTAAPAPEALRQAAMQFEGLLLLQLTSALNGTEEDGGSNGDEDKLFGSDGGTGLAKKMFSEQLATSIAESGGVGLADIITKKLGGNPVQPAPGKTFQLHNAIAAIKEIRNNASSKIQTAAEKTIKPVVSGKQLISSAKSSAAAAAFVPSAVSSLDGIEIVSTAAEDIAKYGDADLPKPVMGDPNLFKYYRPRIVPNYSLHATSDDAGTTTTTTRLESAKNVSPAVNNPATAAAIAAAATNAVSATTVVNYQMPLSGGRVSSEFGDRFHPIDKKVKFHAGVDIAAAAGTPIATAAGGTVSFAGWSEGYGNLIVVQHPDGRETRYGHASKIYVSVGETVAAGQQIAAVGSTGKSTGPHLHFEMRENGKPINPLEFLP